MNNKEYKILNITVAMDRGGAETFMMNIYRNIDKEKYKHFFLCTRNKKGSYDDEIKNYGGKIYHYKSFNSKRCLKVVIDTIKIIKRTGPYDAIYIPMQSYSGIFCIAAKISGIKQIIVHSHSASDGKTSNIIRKLYLEIMRKIINKYATTKLACSKNAALNLYGAINDVDIINNGIDLEKFRNIDNNKIEEIKKKLCIQNNELIIGHIGRFSKEKNHLFFINLAELLINQKIKFKIILVGNGPLFTKFKEIIIEKKMENYFILAGVQSDVQLFYHIFDVYVMPSFYEGFPVTIVEALASGTPCVLSNTITKEVDLIKNATSFLDLNSSIDLWGKSIIEKSKMQLNLHDSYEILKEKGFSIEDTIEKFINIYKGDNTIEKK